LSDLKLARDFIDMAITELRKVDRGTWEKQLAAGGNLLRLALQLRNRGVEVDLDVSFQDPLLQLFKDVRQGRKPLPTFGQALPSLDLLLSPRQQTVYWDLALAALLDPQVIEDPFERLVTSMGADMIRGIPFETGGKNVYLRFLKGAVNRKIIGELSWVRDLLKGRPQMVSGQMVGQDALDDFRKRVQNLASEAGVGDKVREVATDVATLLAIPANMPLF
jgi:hypothetical protein